MEVKQLTLTQHLIPAKLRQIPQPPNQLFILGNNLDKLLSQPCVTIVGSRKVTTYGKAVTTQLTRELAKAGVTIISGLALGVDSIAHQAALDVGGSTVAVLPSGLDYIYPASHRGLARQIKEQGGALVTEYNTNTPIYPVNFIRRNRITSGLGDALLITEATEKSGTLHTARFALEQGKDVFAVPGNITSPTSNGTNNLIKSGAALVTKVDDILNTLGIKTGDNKRKVPTSANPNEQILLDLLFSGVSDGTELLTKSSLGISLYNQTLTMLEIRDRIRPLGNNHWALK
ncbi:MAG TPA: DNA-processing protein DprA [Patescibacteria group bacterium]|jgi:DNA processing protein|nr:DNA-processing protein DprA [Patescibacteria group bacterium]